MNKKNIQNFNIMNQLIIPDIINIIFKYLKDEPNLPLVCKIWYDIYYKNIKPYLHVCKSCKNHFNLEKTCQMISLIKNKKIFITYIEITCLDKNCSEITHVYKYDKTLGLKCLFKKMRKSGWIVTLKNDIYEFSYNF